MLQHMKSPTYCVKWEGNGHDGQAGGLGSVMD